MTQTVLILGATGRFGRAASTAFSAAGWRVRHFDRNSDTLLAQAQGADVIVNAWNPPYPDWADQVPRLHAMVREAASRSGSTVVVPGNVYVFGAETPAPWSEASPHAARNPLGRIRIDMEDSYRRSGVRTIILRAGDFLDTAPSGNWFDQVLVKPLARGLLRYPGATDIPHAWAFLPDLARAAVALAEMRRDLPEFCDVPFAGFTLTGEDMARHLADGIGARVDVRRMAWWPLRLAAPVWPMGRCLLEMRYLWDTPHALDGRLFDRLVPEFQPTPTAQALAEAISWTGLSHPPRPAHGGSAAERQSTGPSPHPAH